MAIEKLEDSALAEIEAHATEFARQAGQIVCAQFRQPTEVQFKGKMNSDPVTAADRLSDECLKKLIRFKFPSHCILSEEGGALEESGSDFTWVIDPLDGTANFMNGLPLFAISIGVLWKRQPVAGSIYVAVSHQGTEGVYHACLGKGAFFNGQKIEVNGKPSGRPLAEIPFRSGLRLSGRSRKEPHEARNLGSIAVELAMAASGVFEYVLFGSPKIWDVAAGVLLVKEAGGLCLVRGAGGKTWQPLERFQGENKGDPESLENLRKWSMPMVAGAPQIASQVARDIRIQRRPLASLLQRFRPKGRKENTNKP